jgi:serine/threonine protein phosphatase PrpC
LPEIHDAWQQDGEAVVLLEDRSGWKMIGDLWGSEETPTLQILSWLGEMTQLWEALEPWHCRQSLLEITNLRVDEDGVLGLVRLYPEAREQPLTLQDLGHMWQMLSNQSQRTQFTSLGGLFRQMCTNEFGTINEVRSHLEAIAHEQQLSAPEAAPYDDLDELLDAGTKSFALGEQPAPVSPNDSDDPTVILPMQLLSLDDSGCTDIGQQRDHNEDCFGILTEVKKQENPMGRAVQARGLYILCDGMGGHDHGEVASKMAVETLKGYFQENWHDQFPTEDSVREAVRLANQAIYDVNQQNVRSGNKRMGTTLVMMLIQNTKAVIAHVGDSRLYCLTRKRGLEQLTIDHSVGQREILRGVDPEIAHARPDAVQLTQALGPRSEHFINPDVKFLELNEDTLFVLCSDGLSDNDLLDDHWQTHLAPLLSSRANLDQGIFQLIELANEHNGHDNITAVLIRVKVRPNFEQQQLL